MDLGISDLDMFFKERSNRDFSPFIHHPTPNSQKNLFAQDDYIKTIDAIIAFLPGKNPSLARQICSGNFYLKPLVLIN